MTSQVVEAMIAVRRTIGTLRVPVLPTLADPLLFELGIEAGKRARGSDARHRH
ncbi:hypothetical protein [Methylobacterium planeticum]|uniref:hypothetical protein n=1 Tax=Methylobacterium planeticum TaxID=2615211 RepID=UPI0017845568|nr:hypothetical protein [Methylobacterium planeticum]